MATRKKLTATKGGRYQKPNRKRKTIIPDGFAAETGFNRKYTARLPANRDKTKRVTVDGKPVKPVADRARKQKNNGGRTKKYCGGVAATACKIREFSDYRRGKLLAPLLKPAIGFLAAEPEFGTNGETRKKLPETGAPAIGRGLKPERKKPETGGKSPTEPGEPLKNRIPVRAYFTWDGRKPGFSG